MSRLASWWLAAETGAGKRRRRRARPRLELAEDRLLLSVTIQVNYDYDVNHFFDTQRKRDLMQQVADSVGSMLDVHLAAIEPTGSDEWVGVILDPSTGEYKSITNPAAPEDTIILYVGGRPVAAPALALGGPAVQYASSYSLDDHGPDWVDFVKTRKGPDDVGEQWSRPGLWAGSIAFDNSRADWYFGVDESGKTTGGIDFVGIAYHEIGHILGIGIDTEDAPWTRYVTPDGFVGPAAVAANGGHPVPLAAPAADHLAAEVTSDGALDVMSPNVAGRNVYSSLDYAVLRDLGWNIAEPSRFQFTAVDPEVPANQNQLVLSVKRIGPTDQAAAVNYLTADGLWWSSASDPWIAHAGVDYQPVSGVLVFAPGEAAKTITVPVMRPAFDGFSGKQFRVILSSPANLAAVGPNSVAAVSIQSSPTNGGGGGGGGGGRPGPGTPPRRPQPPPRPQPPARPQPQPRPQPPVRPQPQPRPQPPVRPQPQPRPQPPVRPQPQPRPQPPVRPQPPARPRPTPPARPQPRPRPLPRPGLNLRANIAPPARPDMPARPLPIPSNPRLSGFLRA